MRERRRVGQNPSPKTTRTEWPLSFAHNTSEPPCAVSSTSSFDRRFPAKLGIIVFLSRIPLQNSRGGKRENFCSGITPGAAGPETLSAVLAGGAPIPLFAGHTPPRPPTHYSRQLLHTASQYYSRRGRPQKGLPEIELKPRALSCPRYNHCPCRLSPSILRKRYPTEQRTVLRHNTCDFASQCQHVAPIDTRGRALATKRTPPPS